MTQIETHSLRIEKTIAAPIEAVRNALTDATLLAQWFAPGDMTAVVHSCDAKVGGHYEIAMTGTGPDGLAATHTCTGEFTGLTPTPVAMTFNWSEEPLPNATQLAYELSPTDVGTRLVLTHEGLPTKELAAMHTEGWEGCLAKLPDAC